MTAYHDTDSDTALLATMASRLLRYRPGDHAESSLDSAFAALEHGDVKGARELAQSVLLAARSAGQQRLQANALTCLAHCDRIGQRLRRSLDTARRAAQLFETLGDADGEARALTTLAQVGMLLGRIDEAYEAALLVMRLSEIRGPCKSWVLALNTLGLTCSWSGNFERANHYLEAAVDVAGRCEPPVSAFQPRVNQAWVEAARLVEERYQTGCVGDLGRFAWLVGEYRRLDDQRRDRLLMPGLEPMAATLTSTTTALLCAWQGRFAQARDELQMAVRSLSGTTTWLDALVRWGVAELAWAQRDLATAEQALIESKALALTVEHEKFACLAQQLLAQVLEESGKTEAARHEHRELRARERRMVTDGHEGRLALVDWRLSARRHERSLEEALRSAKQFEQWSMEDALTGLPNRRCAEQALHERLAGLAAPGRRLTVAMIDVDKFKRINDDFSHNVGDMVLRALGDIMLAQLRENDLPARWAGDEFVIVFSDQDEASARAACDRIDRAIAQHDWDALAAGLSVSVSIGLSQALEGDSIEALVGRSDDRMYESKTMGL